MTHPTGTQNHDGKYEARITELIAQMTLFEKVCQLTQFSSFYDVTGPTPSGDRDAQKHDLLQKGVIGSVLNVVGVDEARALQERAVEHSRLKIPMLFAYDVIHGQKTMFPIPLAESASWDLEKIEMGARVAAIEASAMGLNWTFAPMIDITRDPRWGRVMEGAGEDPYLGSLIGDARVKGFQGEDLSAPDTIVATAKHFAGYGFVEAGKEYNAVELGTVTLNNVVFAPFRYVLENSKPRSVMNAFNTVNGIPATADVDMQRGLLKGEWGFDGVVVSDWASSTEMIDHGFVSNGKEAAEVALIAGSDVDMESYVFLDYADELIQSGAVDESLVDDSVRRLLRIKFELGLFDDPYRYLDNAREQSMLMTDAHMDASLDMARASIVLLKNESNALPLVKNERVAVIGALAADKDAPLGNWRAHAPPHSAMSLIEGFDQAGLEYVFANGVNVQIGDAGFEHPVIINTTDRSGIDEAVEAAKSVEKVVMVLGEPARQSGEGRSRTDLGFPGLQQELLEAVHAVNPNIVLVVMSGRPLVLSWAEKNIPAIVQAWHLGHRSGQAITDVLTGAVNPSGKLPMSFPRSVGQIPVYYNHLNTGRPGPRELVVWAHYIDEVNSPLYPFGYGLSYSHYEYSDLEVEVGMEGVNIQVSVKNVTDVAGEEITQVYIRDKVASITRPVRELKAFQKTPFNGHELKRLSFTLPFTDLGFYNGKGVFTLEAGDFDIFVGGSSQTDLGTEITLSAEHVQL